MRLEPRAPLGWLANEPMRLALSAWALILVIVSVRAIVQPEAHSCYPIFASAARHWLAGEDLYYKEAPAAGALDCYRYSPLVASRIRDMKSVYDSFIISLDSGMAEEIVYRLFILSCFLFSFRHLYSRIAPIWPGVVSILPKALSVVLSSLLFAMVHNVYGFTAAFFGGMLLGLIYIQSGIESAIAAHFCANFLFFSASYLS